MDIQQSIEQILQATDAMGKLFYGKFLTACPEVAPYFANVDWTRQSVQLSTALMIAVRNYARPTPALELYLQYLGTKHRQMQIRREEYPKWKRIMLETLQEFHGPQWNAMLDGQWNEAIDQASSLMLAGYDERITV